MDSEILKLLNQIGLSKTQARIYALLLSRERTIKELVLVLGLARSTLIESLNSLDDLGLIAYFVKDKSGTKMYRAKSLGSLDRFLHNNLNILEDRIQTIVSAQESLNKMLNLLKLTGSFLDSSIDLYLGKKEVLRLYRSTVNIPEVYSICRLDDYYKTFPKGLFLQSQANRLNKKRKFKDLVIDGDSVRELKENIKAYDYTDYEFKVIKDSPLLRESELTDIFITKSYIIFSNFKHTTPFSLKLNSIEISKFLIYLHNIVWESID
ncbi:ArsR family transcriptional regulator [Candidatus Dojkabacteria bacterium]|nr:ArsR family transcriptional regulator [Candidatus Dojkabacteria bacterium]